MKNKKAASIPAKPAKREQKKAPSVAATPEPVNQGRHESQCSVCKHPRREEIEGEFLGWTRPEEISKVFDVSRDSLYRHARALKLMEPRRKNVRSALEKIIEHAGTVKVNAPAVVAAVATYARLNSRGQWVDRCETVDLNALFNRMTDAELRRYAALGELPGWFTAEGATAIDSQEGENAR